MSQMKAGQIIARQREKLGLSQRKLEDELQAIKKDVSRRTIARIESEDFSSTPDKIESVVDFLFQDEDERDRVLKLVEESQKVNRQEIAERRRIRRKMTEASKKYEIEITVHSGVGLSVEKQWEYHDWCDQQREAGKEYLSDVGRQFYFEHRYDKPYITLDIYELAKNGSKDSRVRIALITAEDGLIFFGETGFDFTRTYGEGKYKLEGVLGTYGSAVDWDDAMKPYGEYCTKRGMQKDILLRLAYQMVEQDQFLLSHQGRATDNIPVNRLTLDFNSCKLMEAILLLEENEIDAERKIEVLNKLRNVQASMTEWLKLPEDLPQQRKELLEQIELMISKISPHSV